MLLAGLGFSVMGGAAKILKGSFGAGQLVFWRNTVGILVLIAGFIAKPPKNKGGKLKLPVSYTHLRAHETVLDLVCRLLLEKKKYN